MEKMVVKFARVDKTQFIMVGQDVQRAPKEKHQPLEHHHVQRVRKGAIKSRMLPPTTIVDTARLVHPRILRAKALATIASPVNIQIKMDELHVNTVLEQHTKIKKNRQGAKIVMRGNIKIRMVKLRAKHVLQVSIKISQHNRIVNNAPQGNIKIKIHDQRARIVVMANIKAIMAKTFASLVPRVESLCQGHLVAPIVRMEKYNHPVKQVHMPCWVPVCAPNVQRGKHLSVLVARVHHVKRECTSQRKRKIAHHANHAMLASTNLRKAFHSAMNVLLDIFNQCQSPPTAKHAVMGSIQTKKMQSTAKSAK
jgi:hypothetical protein